MAKAFLDTNVLLCLLSADPAKANVSEALLAEGGVISVQVLNEFPSVASRKLNMDYPEIRDVLQVARSLCDVVPLTIETHEVALYLAERYGFSVYDALIVAAAQLAECEVLYSEDLQDGLRVGEVLKVRNPYKAA